MSLLFDVTTVGLRLQELGDAFRALFVDLFLFLQVARMQLPNWLLRACLGLLYFTEVWTATFKLALIGPWSCDPMFSRAIPTAAANLALSRLRRDGSLSRGYHYDIKLLEEDCSASKGLLAHTVPVERRCRDLGHGVRTSERHYGATLLGTDFIHDRTLPVKCDVEF